MVNPEHQSPNAIPPRTSSTGVVASSASVNPARPVLHPVPENAWIASSSPPPSSSGGPHRRMGSTASGGRGLMAHLRQLSGGRRVPGAGRAPGPSVTAEPVSGGESGGDGPAASAEHPLSAGFPSGDGSNWTAEQEEIVLGPFEYVTQQPGKDVRKQLIAAFNAWLKVPEDRLGVIAKVISMLHNASLLYVLLCLRSRGRASVCLGLVVS